VRLTLLQLDAWFETAMRGEGGRRAKLVVGGGRLATLVVGGVRRTTLVFRGDRLATLVVGGGRLATLVVCGGGGGGHPMVDDEVDRWSRWYE